jgi:hypothetical protein
MTVWLQVVAFAAWRDSGRCRSILREACGIAASDTSTEQRHRRSER